MLENTGVTPQEPNFGDSNFIINPFGITVPLGSNGDLPDGVAPVFGDIDNDGDFDLFYGGTFSNGLPDEAIFFSENIDTSDNGTAPQFKDPEKNPFGISVSPDNVGLIPINFADMDCDGDLDLFLSGGGSRFYYENTGTPIDADFSTSPLPLVAPFNGGAAGSFVDISGDGDIDYIDGYAKFYENLSPAPVADFDTVQNGLEVSFIDLSAAPASASISKWLWDFGDGTTSEEQNPVHTYTVEGSFEVCLTAWYHCRSDEACITVGIAVGTRESYLDADFTLYPNPANDELILELESIEPLRNLEVIIFDVLGKPVRKWSYSLIKTTIQERLNLSGLEQGIYMVKVRTSDKFLAKQFVKM